MVFLKCKVLWEKREDKEARMTAMPLFSIHTIFRTKLTLIVTVMHPTGTTGLIYGEQ